MNEVKAIATNGADEKLSDEPFNDRTAGNIDQLIDVIDSIGDRVKNIDYLTSNIQDKSKVPDPDVTDGQGIQVVTSLDRVHEELYRRLSSIDDRLNELHLRISI